MRQQLGTILVESGICTPEEVRRALDTQRRLAARSHFKHLGAIMLEMDLISLEELDRALERQQGSAGEWQAG